MSTHREHNREVDRYIGLSLGGAKSDRTCLTVIDHYRKQEKAFVIDVFEGVGPEKADKENNHPEFTADQVLLELIEEHQPGIHAIATDAPLTLPPCLSDCEKSCTGYESCNRSEVKWMRNLYKKTKEKNSKLKYFTPYTQRPVELYFKYKFPSDEILPDETLGANLAPQTARMQYLKRHLKNIELIEVWTKLTLLHISKTLKLSKKELQNYRNLERGLHVRERILSRLVEKSQIFIYERDYKKLIQNISAFDSLICGWVALQYGRDQIETFRSDLPLESGWVTLPTF